MSVSYGGDSITFADNSIVSSGWTGYKNRIINGAMTIDQRNAGASVTLTSSGVFPVDRYQCDEDTDGVMTGQQTSTAPAGFINSLKITTTTADASLGATQYAAVIQKIVLENANLGTNTSLQNLIDNRVLLT